MSIGYFYDPVTYRLTGPASLMRDPKRPSNFLVPANCTLLEPPSEYTIEQHPTFNEGIGQWELGPSEYLEQLENQKAEAETMYGTPLYEEDINGNWVERDEATVQAEDDAKQAQIDYDIALEEIKNTMDQNIVLKAMEVTKGTSIESVQAFTSAFHLRANNPAEYVGEGLKVYYPIDTYVLGADLDTEIKIGDYYKKILIYLDKFREAEINNYITAKAQIPLP